MGLDTSHDCWHGAYSAFMRWREALADAAGMPPFRRMEGIGGDIKWEWLKPDVLHVLLNHSDCDGVIEAQDCGPLADRLEELLPALEKLGAGFGHVVSYSEKTRQFIDGLRRAAAAGEAVVFS